MINAAGHSHVSDIRETLFIIDEKKYFINSTILQANPMLVGWFDRVWTYGFAYGDKTMKMLDKAIILCSAGNSLEHLEQFGLLDSMKKVMLGDWLFGRAKEMEFVVLTARQEKMNLERKTGT